MKKFIESIPLDKLRHLVVGIIYATLILILGAILGTTGAIAGFLIGTFLNAYKEIWIDYKQGKGNPELLDFVYNEIPIVLVFIGYLM